MIRGGRTPLLSPPRRPRWRGDWKKEARLAEGREEAKRRKKEVAERKAKEEAEKKAKKEAERKAKAEAGRMTRKDSEGNLVDRKMVYDAQQERLIELEVALMEEDLIEGLGQQRVALHQFGVEGVGLCLYRAIGRAFYESQQYSELARLTEVRQTEVRQTVLRFRAAVVDDRTSPKSQGRLLWYRAMNENVLRTHERYSVELKQISRRTRNDEENQWSPTKVRDRGVIGLAAQVHSLDRADLSKLLDDGRPRNKRKGDKADDHLWGDLDMIQPLADA